MACKPKCRAWACDTTKIQAQPGKPEPGRTVIIAATRLTRMSTIGATYHFRLNPHLKVIVGRRINKNVLSLVRNTIDPSDYSICVRVLLSILRSARRHHQGLLKDQEIDGDLNGRQAEQAEMKQEAAAAATRTACGIFVMRERDVQTHRRRREGVEAENWPSVLQRQVLRGIQEGKAGCLMSHRDRSWEKRKECAKNPNEGVRGERYGDQEHKKGMVAQLWLCLQGRRGTNTIILDLNTYILESPALKLLLASVYAKTEVDRVFRFLSKLVILHTYLHRSSQDDLQIYFLAYRFTPTELQNLSADDPFAAAKKGGIIRHSTVPEIVLQTPESDHEGIPTHLCWCKMRTVLHKTAAARIPASFVPATAYLDGQEYNWNSTGSPTTINSLTAIPLAYEFSSPLSDPPPSQTKGINPLLQSGLMTEDIEMGAIGCKRRVQERRVAPKCILQRRLMLRFVGGEAHDHKWFTVHVLGLTWPNLGKRVNLAVVMASDGIIDGTAVTSTQLSSDISMGYSILDLIVTLRLYQDPETPKAVKWPSNDAKSFLGSSGGKTVQTDVKHHRELIKFGNTSMRFLLNRRALIRDRNHGSTAPVPQVSCWFRQLLSLLDNGTATAQDSNLTAR
ncbi:hypothetical protein C8J57DRAFT_1249909 [Mycena rebaudengoi]|nr:hypothetical protein C8J57DRAFT_1249909 [Mycena rebaudengoi]